MKNGPRSCDRNFYNCVKKPEKNSGLVLMSQHNWLKWLDGNVDFVRIFSFDFSKAFDSVSHRILDSKLRNVDINPYILN